METREADERLGKLNIKKIDDYLYSAEYDDYDYGYASDRMAMLFAAGGCAAVRNGDFRGRNYDWTFDEQAYFVIKTPAKNGRHAVLGMAGTIAQLTAESVSSGKWMDEYMSLPFATLDGVNDAGVICNILVVPCGEAGLTTGSNPEGEDLFAGMVNRYVLDYAGSVDEALELLRKRNIYMPHNSMMNQEFHWMISDPEKTVVVEFVNNEMTVVEDEKIATNFYLYNYDKTGKTVQRVPEGIERYRIIRDGYDTTGTREGMMDMLRRIRFSKAYDLGTVPFWYSEYCEGDLDSSGFGEDDISDGDFSRAGAYGDAIRKGIAKFANGRNGNTWITVFSAVYDMKNLTLDVCSQERDAVYSFSLNG